MGCASTLLDVWNGSFASVLRAGGNFMRRCGPRGGVSGTSRSVSCTSSASGWRAASRAAVGRPHRPLLVGGRRVARLVAHHVLALTVVGLRAIPGDG
jgi:hypothetical protein